MGVKPARASARRAAFGIAHEMPDVIEEDLARKRQLAVGFGAGERAHERALLFLFVAGRHGKSGRAPTPVMV